MSNLCRNILLLIGMIIVNLSFAQNHNSISKDSTLNQESKIERIQRLRSLMIDAVVDEDYQKIGWIEKEISENLNPRYVGLYLYETVAIDFLTASFQEILPAISYLDSNKTTYQNDNLILPRPDQLSKQLNLQLFDNRERILSTLRNSYLEDEEKDILEIFFVLWVHSTDTSMTQDSLNALSKDFLNDYPESPYYNYVKEEALIEYITSKWGFGFDFFSGFGWFDGPLSTYFNNAVPIGIGFDIQYKTIVLSLRNYIGFTRTTSDMQFQEDIWESNETALLFLPEASIGFEAINSNRVKIFPFAGISSMDLGPTLDKSGADEYDKISLDFTSAPCFGINMDFKIKSIYNFVTNSGQEASYSFIRIRYSYHQPNYESRFDGGFHSICIGFGGFGRSVKRKTYE